ncbi:hypothetical protein MPSEU_001085900 [Mayamaea pseudoterrestris]|nr:hypothetical protein MPSEU_001085900 [Mayamaea pseudoterrestris]
MRLGLVATSLALPAISADVQRTDNRRSSNKQGTVIGQILEDIRSRMLTSDGVGPFLQLQEQQRHGKQALWKSLPTRKHQQQRHADVSGKDGDEIQAQDEPDVGILSHRSLEQEAPEAGVADEYIDYKFCDLFRELSAFDNMVCDCQNNPRASVSCQSPNVCYQSIDPSVCLSTHVDLVPREDQETLNLQVCYRLREPTHNDYCFSTEINYQSFFEGNETIYESCELSVNGQQCNACEITSRSLNAGNCTGLSDFDCSNTAANTVASKECSTFYNPFPEVTRIEGIHSGGGSWRRRNLMAMTMMGLGAALAWGGTWI